jgi:hypothetical protein
MKSAWEGTEKETKPSVSEASVPAEIQTKYSKMSPEKNFCYYRTSILYLWYVNATGTVKTVSNIHLVMCVSVGSVNSPLIL